MNLHRVYIFDENDFHPGPIDYTGENSELQGVLYALKHLDAPHVMVCDGLDMIIFEARRGKITWPENLVEVQRIGMLEQAIVTIEEWLIVGVPNATKN